MIATAVILGEYFLFGFRSGEGGLFDDLCCVHFVGFERGELVALCEAALNFKYAYFAEKTTF